MQSTTLKPREISILHTQERHEKVCLNYRIVLWKLQDLYVYYAQVGISINLLYLVTKQVLTIIDALQEN